MSEPCEAAKRLAEDIAAYFDHVDGEEFMEKASLDIQNVIDSESNEYKKHLAMSLEQFKDLGDVTETKIVALRAELSGLIGFLEGLAEGLEHRDIKIDVSRRMEKASSLLADPVWRFDTEKTE